MNPGRNGVLRRAFVMSLDSGREVEYRKRHNPVWPEMVQVLRDHGVSTYSIFLDPSSGLLFAYVEFESREQWDAIARTEVCQRWWAYMRDIMASNPDNSPVERELCEVFHLEGDDRRHDNGGTEDDCFTGPAALHQSFLKTDD